MVARQCEEEFVGKAVKQLGGIARSRGEPGTTVNVGDLLVELVE